MIITTTSITKLQSQMCEQVYGVKPIVCEDVEPLIRSTSEAVLVIRHDVIPLSPIKETHLVGCSRGSWAMYPVNMVRKGFKMSAVRPHAFGSFEVRGPGTHWGAHASNRFITLVCEPGNVEAVAEHLDVYGVEEMKTEDADTGVGTTYKSKLAKFKLRPCHECNTLEAEMNRMGPKCCRANAAELARRSLSNITNQSRFVQLIAGAVPVGAKVSYLVGLIESACDEVEALS